MKPCPFCGSGRLDEVSLTRSTEHDLDQSYDAIECLDCGAIARRTLWAVPPRLPSNSPLPEVPERFGPGPVITRVRGIVT